MASLQVQLIDVNRELVHVDPANHALLVTSADGGSSGAGGSWAIDKGISFTAWVHLNLTANARMYMHISVGANPIRATVSTSVEEGAAMSFYEGATITVESAVSLLARNRTASETTTTTIFRPTSITLDGTELWSATLPPGHKDTQEWNLAANTSYIVFLQNVSAIAGRASVNVDFWEPDLI